VALVTGGGSGIGRAAVVALAEAGASVVVAGRRAEPLAETVRMTRDAGGHAIEAVCDVSDEESVRAMVEAATSNFGRLDVAANCAALPPGGPIDEITTEQFDRTIAVNLRGMWLSVKYEAAAMAVTSGGAIVNVSSVSAQHGGPSDYAASKAGVEGLTRGAAGELAAYGIRVNALRAGLFDTPMLHAAWETGDDPETVLAPGVAATMLGRVGYPSEAAQAILWLCSPDSAYVTGSCLTVDGGISARW
jgi:NAD(P)-dependent dehydrogenase (short-subunit alcohol dehydrogenase family)